MPTSFLHLILFFMTTFVHQQQTFISQTNYYTIQLFHVVTFANTKCTTLIEKKNVIYEKFPKISVQAFWKFNNELESLTSNTVEACGYTELLNSFKY